MIVNFYWSGKQWQFINRLTIASHLQVGHEVVIWVNKPAPVNKYWISDFKLTIKDANKIVNTKNLLLNGWNVRTISTLFQYKLMDETGEYTSDCDAIALKHWPDKEWCLVSESKRLISSVGVLRVPKGHPVLAEAIKKANKFWGNVKIFSKCCKRHKLKSTYDPRSFYPVTPHPNSPVPYILRDGNIPDAYSYHIFFKSANKKGIKHEMVDDPKYKNSLLRKLAKFAFKDYGYTN